MIEPLQTGDVQSSSAPDADVRWRGVCGQVEEGVYFF